MPEIYMANGVFFSFRIENVLEFLQSRQPVLSHAEVGMKEELDKVAKNIEAFQKSFKQVKEFVFMAKFNLTVKGRTTEFYIN